MMAKLLLILLLNVAILCSVECSRQLMKCGEKLEMLYKAIQNDIKVAEAYAYYNALEKI
jgi:hypothetical protein